MTFHSFIMLIIMFQDSYCVFVYVCEGLILSKIAIKFLFSWHWRRYNEWQQLFRKTFYKTFHFPFHGHNQFLEIALFLFGDVSALFFASHHSSFGSLYIFNILQNIELTVCFFWFRFVIYLNIRHECIVSHSCATTHCSSVFGTRNWK